MASLTSSSSYSLLSPPRHVVGRDPCSSPPTEHFMHITGEMTNPEPLEKFIMEHPMVHSAVMFGHGRYNAGILVKLEVDGKVDADDPKQMAEMRNKLEPALERMNMFAPQHARVQKEMILFATPAKSFIYNPFITTQINRRATLAKYNDEINALYTTIDRAAYLALKPPKIWSPDKSITYVRGITVVVLGKWLSNDADFFDHGTDSFQATRIRIMLFHALQSTTEIDTRKLSGNIVYHHRTIASLATFASRAALACFRFKTESRLERCLEIRETVESHSLDFPEHRPSMPPPYEDVVLITGTTGLFGSSLLTRFLQCPRIKVVYALNRRKSSPGSVVDRQAALLRASGLDPTLAFHPKLVFLEANARQNRLGLPPKVYEQLLSSVTHIVHNAWLSTRDDNLPLYVFEGSFRMLRNLVDFALSSPLPVPPRLLFISSTDILQCPSENTLGCASEAKRTGGPLVPEGPVSPCDAADGIYGKSKWVGEQILLAAASETPLRPIIVRVGPLCGAANGRWRKDAHLPMIVHLSSILGALPKVDEIVHWIPVHTAAQIVVEMRNAFSTHLHVTHPLPISSLSLLRYISSELRLPVVGLSDWIAKLETHVHTTPLWPSSYANMDPALVLLRHLQRTRDPTALYVPTRIFGHVQITFDDAWLASPTLHGGMCALGIADVRLWLQHWKETGMIPQTESP